MLRGNPKAKLGFNVGGAAGLGGLLTGVAGHKLYRALTDPEPATMAPQPNKP